MGGRLLTLSWSRRVVTGQELFLIGRAAGTRFACSSTGGVKLLSVAVRCVLRHVLWFVACASFVHVVLGVFNDLVQLPLLGPFDDRCAWAWLKFVAAANLFCIA